MGRCYLYGVDMFECNYIVMIMQQNDDIDLREFLEG